MRKRALPLHDLHHIATGYGTTILGEAEVAAWELAPKGLGKYPNGWIYVLAMFFIGLALYPKKTLQAFKRGKNCTNLFNSDFKSEILDDTVAELRKKVGLTC